MKAFAEGFFNSQKNRTVRSVTAIGPRIIPKSMAYPESLIIFDNPYDCMSCEQLKSLCYLHAKMKEKGIPPIKYRPWDVWAS